jgi:serine/threonine protein kinase
MFKTIRELGKGSFGLVTLVKAEEDDSYYACKEISDVIDILVGVRETDALLRVNHLHPSIVHLHSHSLSMDGDRYTIQQYLEFCSEGSLEEVLDKEFKTPDLGIRPCLGGIRNRLEQLCSMVGALDFLQTYGIYHMDIKTENILFRRQGGMCLCDFSNYYLETDWKEGLATPLIPLESLMYRPPEVGFMRNTWESNRKTDVWALGVLFLETLGCWEYVLQVDDKVMQRGNRVKGLAEKIKILQTNYIKRNGRVGFRHPFQIIFGNLGKECGDSGFGKQFLEETSPEFEMILSCYYASEYTSRENMDKSLCISKEYFSLRKETSDHDLLDKVYQEVIPLLFQIDHSKRPSMGELYILLCEILGKTPERFVSTPPPSKPLLNLSLWERIPDPLWRDCFEDLFEASKDMKICYGKNSDFTLPLHCLMFAKHLSEDVFEMLIAGMEKEYLIPTDFKKRQTFYELILSACILIASEFMDFIFPVQDSDWFSDKPLSEVAPFLKLCIGLLMGKIGDSAPTLAEKQVIQGVLKI